MERTDEVGARFRQVVDSCRDAFIEVDAHARITEWSRQAEELFGWTHGEVVGSPIAELISPRFNEVLMQGMQVLRSETDSGTVDWPSFMIDLEFIHRDGRLILATGAVFVTGSGEGFRIGGFIHDASIDTTVGRVLARDRLHDILTGLPNRSLFTRRLTVALDSLQDQPASVAVAVLDVDRFKAINDALGHAAGDRALRSVAEALRGAIRAEDGAYRYGGEEFVVVMEVAEPHEELVAAERIRRIVEDLDLPNPGNPPSGRVTVSVGVACVGPSDMTADDEAWFSLADAAMYRAKAAGRNRCESAVRPVEAL